jgi:hypothetical protein
MLPVMIRSGSPSKLLLVADRRPASAELGTVAVRRFRLARVRLEGRAAGNAPTRAVKSS